MGQITRIEWTDSSINAMMGCDGCELWNPKVGIENCYAGTLTARYAGSKGWPKAFNQPTMFPERLQKALNWSDLTGKERPDKPHLNDYPRLIFLDDMGDTFTESLPIDWLMSHIPAMERSPHIFQFLTKRPKRMVKFFKQLGRIPANFWLMTSITSQETIGRVSDLLRLKEVDRAAILGLSVEPLLGPVDLSGYLGGGYVRISAGKIEPMKVNNKPIDWVIVGGESGPGARPMHLEWARKIRDDCMAAGVPFFFKQHGEWINKLEIADLIDGRWRVRPEWMPVTQGKRWGCLSIDGEYRPETTTWNGRQNDPQDDYEVIVYGVGKHAAGRLLDGREWNEMPQTLRHAQDTAQQTGQLELL